MKRSSAPPSSDDLLNLPLAGPGADDHGPAGTPGRQESLIFEPGNATDPPTGAGADRDPGGGPDHGPHWARLQAGLVDFLAVAGATALAAAGARILGADLDLGTLPALAGFGVSFSFLYHVVPLAFWGRSPGMARFALVARDASGVQLTLYQAAARWLGALVTVLGLALPLLLLFSGRTLADRLSGSRVTRVPSVRRRAA